MRISSRLKGFVIAAFLAASGIAGADPLYAITVLGGAGSSSADINARGDVVGNYRSGDDTLAFVHAGAGFTALGTLGGAGSWAHAINDSGQVVGGAATATGDIHAFVYGTSMSDLGTFGGRYSEAYDIDNAGVIVGTALPAVSQSLYDRQAFRYEDGAMQGLGTLPGGAGSTAHAISDTAGLVGGASYAGPVTLPDYPYHAVLFGAGGVQDLGAPDIDNSAVYGVNDLGQAVGAIPTSNLIHASHAFLYDNGVLVDLGLLDPLGDDSIAYDINNVGQVVGRAGAGAAYHGFLYSAQDGMIDLNTLVDPASGLEIVDAAGINAAGQIAATACTIGVAGECFAVRLDLVPAVPEPGTWAMMALGLAAVGMRRRRKHA